MAAPALAGLTTLLADDPVVAAATGGLGEPGRGPGTGARAVRARRSRGDGPPAGRARGADRRRGRAPRRRPARVPRRRRGRAVPRVGDAAVRAGVARDRDDGPPAARDLAAARRRRPPPRGRSSRRCARSCSGSARTSRTSSRSSSRPGRRSSTATSSSSGSSRWATGASTRSRRAARSRCAGSIVDVYPSTADHPVRIDLWGDEVDRLSQFSVADQRSTDDGRRRRGSSRCASCCRPTRCAPAPPSSLQTAAVGRASSGSGSPRARPSTAWSRGCRGSRADEHLLPDLLPPSALVALIEPRRLRDRAQELLDEEAALARDARDHVGRDARPRRHAAPVAAVRPAARAHQGADRCRCSPAPDSPDTPVLAASAFDPVVGDTDALAQRLNAVCAPTASACSSPPRAPVRADRIEQLLADEGVSSTASPTIADDSPVLQRAGRARRRRAARPRRGAARRAARDRRRSRPHRPPARAPPAARRAHAAPTTTKVSPPATSSCTACTASAATSAWRRKRDVRHHARPPRRRVQGRRPRLRRLRGHRAHPQVHRRRGRRSSRRWAAPTGRRRGPACARRCATSRASSSCSTAGGSRHPGHAFAADTPVPAPDRGVVPVRGDARPGARRSSRPRPTWSGRSRWTGSCAATSATARPRSRCAPRPRRCSTASRSRSSCPPRCSRASTARRSASGSRTIRCASRCCRGS